MRPALRDYVSSWVGYDYRMSVDAVHHAVPSTGLTVVLAMDDPLDCGWLTDTVSARFDVLVAGLHTQPAPVRTHGRQHALQLSLNPLGARALLGLPSAALAHEIVDGCEVGWPRHLVDQLREASWRQRFTLLGDFLLARLPSAPLRCRPEVAHVWNQLCRFNGALSVERLAASTGLSQRRLTTLVREELGLAPKQAARVARFQYASRCSRRENPCRRSPL